MIYYSFGHLCGRPGGLSFSNEAVSTSSPKASIPDAVRAVGRVGLAGFCLSLWSAWLGIARPLSRGVQPHPYTKSNKIARKDRSHPAPHYPKPAITHDT